MPKWKLHDPKGLNCSEIVEAETEHRAWAAGGWSPEQVAYAIKVDGLYWREVKANPVEMPAYEHFCAYIGHPKIYWNADTGGICPLCAAIREISTLKAKLQNAKEHQDRRRQAEAKVAFMYGRLKDIRDATLGLANEIARKTIDEVEVMYP